MTILKKRLFRRAALVTPNLPESEVLTGIYPRSEHRLRNAAMVFKMLGNEACCSRAGMATGRIVRDVLWTGANSFPSRLRVRIRAIPMAPAARLATAIACGLAQKLPLREAVARAEAYVQAAIRRAGGKDGPLNHSLAGVPVRPGKAPLELCLIGLKGRTAR